MQTVLGIFWNGVYPFQSLLIQICLKFSDRADQDETLELKKLLYRKRPFICSLSVYDYILILNIVPLNCCWITCHFQNDLSYSYWGIAQIYCIPKVNITFLKPKFTDIKGRRNEITSLKSLPSHPLTPFTVPEQSHFH